MQLLLPLLFFVCTSAFAGSDVYFKFSDFTDRVDYFTNGLGKFRVKMTSAITVRGTNTVLKDWVDYSISTNGDRTVTNMAYGIYTIQITAKNTESPFQITITNGSASTLNAKDLITTSTNTPEGTTAYSIAASRALFIEDPLTQTNGQALVWNSASNAWIPGAASGGGSSGNYIADTNGTFYGTLHGNGGLNLSNPDDGDQNYSLAATNGGFYLFDASYAMVYDLANLPFVRNTNGSADSPAFTGVVSSTNLDVRYTANSNSLLAAINATGLSDTNYTVGTSNALNTRLLNTNTALLATMATQSNAAVSQINATNTGLLATITSASNGAINISGTASTNAITSASNGVINASGTVTTNAVNASLTTSSNYANTVGLNASNAFVLRSGGVASNLTIYTNAVGPALQIRRANSAAGMLSNEALIHLEATAGGQGEVTMSAAGVTQGGLRYDSSGGFNWHGRVSHSFWIDATGADVTNIFMYATSGKIAFGRSRSTAATEAFDFIGNTYVKSNAYLRMQAMTAAPSASTGSGLIYARSNNAVVEMFTLNDSGHESQISGNRFGGTGSTNGAIQTTPGAQPKGLWTTGTTNAGGADWAAGNLTANTNIFAPLATLTNGIVTLSSNGAPPFAITIGASPTGFTNTTGKNVTVYIDGVSVTGTVAINGGTVFNTIGTCTVLLQTNEVVTMTYTLGTPTAKWKPF